MQKFRQKNQQKGFTLVEIMIVVAIVALLAALPVPNIVRAKISANESAAESTLKTVSIACESFRAAQAVPTYPANTAALTGATPPYIDVTVFGANKQGYVNTYTFISASEFVCSAHPVSVGNTGNRRFAVSNSSILPFFMPM